MNALLVASIALLLPAIASAQPAVTADLGPAPAPTPEQDDPSVAITVSPLHLIVPMAEVTIEARVAPKVGIAIVAGAGATRVDTVDDPIRLIEGGASVRYYATGSFRTGLQLGAEAIYVHASVDDPSVEVTAQGLALSPFAGYKWTHGSGFTLDGQLGVSFYTLRAESNVQMSSRKDMAAMLNLNAGWSF